MKKLITNYTFDASAKQITFTDYASISLASVLLITNVTDNIIIYNFADSGGTVAGNVLTLTYNTASMDNGDKLQIFYDDPLFDIPINDVDRVKTSNLPADITPVTGTITGNGQTISVSTDRVSNVMCHCYGTFSTINCIFEGSLDSTNGTDGHWFGIQAVRSNANTVETATGNLSAAPAYGWELSVNALRYMRVRATAWTSGTQSWVFALGSYATEPIPAIQTHAITGTVSMTTTTVGGSATVVGFGQYRNIALSNTDQQIKATAGRIYSWYFKNPHATDTAWVHFYNATAANVTVGTTVPVWSVEVKAGQFMEAYLTIPVSMATAITIAATTSADHTVSTAPTTALVVFVGYI